MQLLMINVFVAFSFWKSWFFNFLTSSMCVSNYIICLYDVYIICMPSLLFLPNLNLSVAILRLSITCSKDSSSSLRNLRFLSVYSFPISTYRRFIAHSKIRTQFYLIFMFSYVFFLNIQASPLFSLSFLRFSLHTFILLRYYIYSSFLLLYIPASLP